MFLKLLLIILILYILRNSIILNIYKLPLIRKSWQLPDIAAGVFELDPDNDKPVVVCCIPGKEFTPGFFDSWTKLLLATSRGLPFDIIVSRHYSPVIFHCRANLLGADNRAGIHQIPFQGKVDYDYIMWFDSDIVFEPEQVVKLFAQMQKDKTLEVLCGIYLTTSGTHSTIVKDWDLNYFLKTGMFPFLSPGDLKELANAHPKRLAEVFYAGMGFMMCRSGTIEKVTYPWFEPIMHEIEISKDFSSELSLVDKVIVPPLFLSLVSSITVNTVTVVSASFKAGCFLIIAICCSLALYLSWIDP